MDSAAHLNSFTKVMHNMSGQGQSSLAACINTLKKLRDDRLKETTDKGNFFN